MCDDSLINNLSNKIAHNDDEHIVDIVRIYLCWIALHLVEYFIEINGIIMIIYVMSEMRMDQFVSVARLAFGVICSPVICFCTYHRY